MTAAQLRAAIHAHTGYAPFEYRVQGTYFAQVRGKGVGFKHRTGATEAEALDRLAIAVGVTRANRQVGDD